VIEYYPCEGRCKNKEKKGRMSLFSLSYSPREKKTVRDKRFTKRKLDPLEPILGKEGTPKKNFGKRKKELHLFVQIAISVQGEGSHRRGGGGGLFPCAHGTISLSEGTPKGEKKTFLSTLSRMSGERDERKKSLPSKEKTIYKRERQEGGNQDEKERPSPCKAVEQKIRGSEGYLPRVKANPFLRGAPLRIGKRQ